MLVRDGCAALARYHWERLFAGLRQLGVSLPGYFTPAFLEEEVLRCVRANELERLCRVRVQVYGGQGALQEQEAIPGFVIECFPLDDTVLQLNGQGLVTGIASGLHKSSDALSGLKTTSVLLYVAAAQQAQQQGWDDALIMNTQGHVIESTIANIFWIKEEKLYTPPLEDGCIAGVMRRFVLERAAAAGVPVAGRSLAAAQLAEADEVFLTNAIRGIKWIGTVAGRTLQHDIVKELYPVLLPPAYTAAW